jgi:translation initiation factor IF-2
MAAKKIAETDGISINTFEVIYKLIDEIKSEASKLLPPEVIEDELGRLKVLAIFRDDKKAFVAGGKIESGRMLVGDTIKVLQDNNEKYRDKVTSLRQGKNEVKECDAGIECGFSISPGANVAVGDTVIAFSHLENKRTIE